MIRRHTIHCTLSLTLLMALLLPLQAQQPSPSTKGPAVMPTGAEIVSRIKSDHPRIQATAEDFARAKKLIDTDPQAKAWFATIKDRGSKLLEAPPSQYVIPDGKRLLATSRRILDRIWDLGLLHQLDGDPKWADRAWLELQTAAAFKDWNPSHFLDTGEMAHAFAIGYDWLYDAWSHEQRQVLIEAIVRHGLEPAMVVYRDEGRHHKWHVSRHNWNQVCNGGVGIAALAIADQRPELAAQILDGMTKSLPRAMATYAPQGAWFEGPGYWHYATRYTVYLLAALETAIGSDLGFSDYEGFSETGNFIIDMISPIERTFNFADVGGDTAPKAEEMLWLARRFQRPELVDYVIKHAGPHPLELLWYGRIAGSQLMSARPTPPPLARHYRVTEVVTARTAWNDPQALWVGFKAGSNDVNHSNLDLGSFVFDAAGQRWAVDPGADNYNMPGYFDIKAQRWTYYRMRAEGHNTLVINPDMQPDQDPKAATVITHFEVADDATTATADLTPAYARHAQRVTRRITLNNKARSLRLEDNIALNAPGDVWWFMHTRAEVAIADDARSATLSQGDRKLTVRLLAPDAAKLTLMTATPLPGTPNPPMQNQNEGLRKLAIHLTGFLSDTIDVRLETQ